MDTFFSWLPAKHSPESRKTIRTVVSLVLRVAVQHEALRTTPSGT